MSSVLFTLTFLSTLFNLVVGQYGRYVYAPPPPAQYPPYFDPPPYGLPAALQQYLFQQYSVPGYPQLPPPSPPPFPYYPPPPPQFSPLPDPTLIGGPPQPFPPPQYSPYPQPPPFAFPPAAYSPPAFAPQPPPAIAFTPPLSVAVPVPVASAYLCKTTTCKKQESPPSVLIKFTGSNENAPPAMQQNPVGSFPRNGGPITSNPSPLLRSPSGPPPVPTPVSRQMSPSMGLNGCSPNNRNGGC